jgi:23S rRNA (cytidine1920-2'-O)/16S rRNA (cytidine1409-2'-O)-methyltransferase
MTVTRKERLDRLLIERGLVLSRQRARALIMAGKVIVEDTRIEKPGAFVGHDAHIHIKGDGCPYVSRGGLKLQAALGFFGIDPMGRMALDVGASTGGFTDCLLQMGATQIFAVDVGYGQLAWKLQQDPRVVNLERRNIRYLQLDEIGEPVDLIVVDTSFISVEKFLHRLCPMVKNGGDLLILIKPQFEVGKGMVGKGGIVRDPDRRQNVVERIRDRGELLGLKPKGTMESPIRGTKGNIEIFIHFLREN